MSRQDPTAVQGLRGGQHIFAEVSEKRTRVQSPAQRGSLLQTHDQETRHGVPHGRDRVGSHSHRSI